MAYLGDIAVLRRRGRIAWTRTTIAEVLIGEIVSSYASYGGYVFVG